MTLPPVSQPVAAPVQGAPVGGAKEPAPINLPTGLPPVVVIPEVPQK